MTQRHPARRPGEAIGRRDFLRIAGTGLAGAALLATVGPTSVLAQETSPLEKEFEDAAKKYEVPKELLIAMAYVNTRLEMPSQMASEYKASTPGLGDPEAKGAYGIMQLVRNPANDTLGEAANLTGISVERLKTDRASNIMGGAALLAASQGEKPNTLGDYYGALSGKSGKGKSYEAISGVGAGDYFASDTLKVAERGFSKRTKKGERISLLAQSLSSGINIRGEVVK